jgi:AmmeMemoRadiSam system protein B
MRKAAVAGSFYAGSSRELRHQIEACFKHSLGPGALPITKEKNTRHILGLVSPHAGYSYSGPVASHGFSRIASEGAPETVIILGLNHRAIGSPLAISKEKGWQTPLGSVETDLELGEQIVTTSRWLQWDDTAHAWEHSLEVQLPFLQYIYGSDFKIVPIAMLRQDLEVSRDLGQAIASSVKDKDAVVIGSTDFSHYEAQSLASRNDQLAINAILDLSPQQLEKVVVTHDISMCGVGPVMAMLVACKQLGADNARLLRYATSGDITEDYSRVVGYASIEVTK